ncbi:hypothetical protein RFI_00224 [Reticulomyxa filosa]|uniref:LamG-like jellyroll fold domain-containing protein n=1 Tax=Reticulomyxa filosa TaxID=46433 RepID=X6PGM1_RETFI|nr:hypothetical protein RFI_00224 [Reticulomyxa filosa]|eukprot:ETO36837.1 hypothetical protein RFI_00224 [Reticulomyxa filosa]
MEAVLKDIRSAIVDTISRKCKLDFPAELALVIESFANQWIKFEDYEPGKCVETQDIGQIPLNFTLVGWIRPNKDCPKKVQMIATKDECCVGTNQFRFQIHADKHVAFFASGGPDGYDGSKDLLVATACVYLFVYDNRWFSKLTTADPLEPEIWTNIALRQKYDEKRDRMEWDIFVDGQKNVTLFSSVGDAKPSHNNQVTFRIGTRHQGLHGSGGNWQGKNNDLHDPFYGDLKRFFWCDNALSDQQIATASRRISFD